MPENSVHLCPEQPVKPEPIPFKWESIGEGTTRSKVFGGWIVQDSMCDQEGNTISMVFIADPNHEWEIAKS